MYKILFLLLLPLFSFAKFQVTTYFPLESFLVKKISGNQVKTKEIQNRFLPDFIELSRSELSRLSGVKIYFHFGLDVELKYAKILQKFNSELIIIDLSSGIDKIDNNHYIWMDPLLLRDVAKNIYDSLIKVDRLNKKLYEENYNNFLDELDQTFLRIKEKMYQSQSFNFFVYDDYWFYFAKRFRINLFKREKTYVKASDIKEVFMFSQKKSINKLIINEGDSYTIAKSLSNSCNIDIVENNPFKELLLINQLEFAQEISK